ADWIDENAEADPTATTRSSLAATKAAMGFADQYRFAVVLRFGAFYGADPNTRWLLDRVRRGKPVLVGDPGGYVSPITVEDAAGAVVAALAAPSGIYNVAGQPVTRDEWARVLGAAASVNGSTGAVTAAGSETSAASMSSHAVKSHAAARSNPASIPASIPAKFVPPFSRRLLGSRAELAGRSLRISSDAFYTATGWRARTDLADGFVPAAKVMH
ncbi:MAG TPA: hypothetical protein VFI22_09210, partial [Thermomicrobiales bacterium]|nr:hypothetical protein [Thermomicrobiales bacterium]